MQTFDQARLTAPKAYLTKPFRENELIFQIELVFEQFLTQTTGVNNPSVSDIIYVFVENAHFRIDKKEIVAIEADNAYIKIFARDLPKPMLVTMGLKRFSGYLTGPNFFRLSRKYLVNLDYLQKFDNDRIWLNGLEQTLPIPQNGRKQLMSRLAVVKIL